MKPDFHHSPSKTGKTRSVLFSQRGQTLIYLLTMMGVIMILILWLFDYNTTLVTRIRSQNAADGSAMAAAQWQARSLNSIGELNLVKAISTLVDQIPPGTAEFNQEIASAGNDHAKRYEVIQRGLDSLQARLQFVGPMMGMFAAQQVARNNKAEINPIFTEFILDHAQYVEDTYEDVFQVPEWGGTTKWHLDYAKMIRFIGNEGVAAAADNADFFGSQFDAGSEAQRYLLNQNFYRAIAGRNWCYLEDILPVYTDFTYWGNVSVVNKPVTGNEFFGLGLQYTSSDELLGPNGLSDEEFQTLRNYFTTELTERGMILHTDWPQFIPPINWVTYAPSKWTNWEKAETYESALLAAPRTFYDYSGCDAVVAIHNYSTTNSLMLAMNDHGEDHASWLVGGKNKTNFKDSVDRLQGFGGGHELDVRTIAAAKPFGKLPDATVNDPPHTFAIVLPVFDKVRMIPVALASSFGNSDPVWVKHKLHHVPPYTQSGLGVLEPSCFYCNMLTLWEDPSFRVEGNSWLNAIDPVTGAKLHECIEHQGGGGGSGPGPTPFPH